MLLNAFNFIHRRLPWLNAPITLLVMLLQKSPVLKLVSLTDEMVPTLSPTSILQTTVVAAASLGAVHTLVGASGIVTTPSSLTATTGIAANAVFTVTGTIADPSSWQLIGNVPPGMNFSGLTSSGIVNVVTANGAAVLSGTPTTPGTYTFQMIAYWYPNATGLSTSAKSYTVTVIQGAVTLPVLVSNPSSQTIITGSQLNLSVSVTGTANYQWQLNGVNIAGATQSSYSVTSATSVNAGTYTCLVSNSAGSVTSSPAVVTVVSAPVIVSSPPPTQSVAIGSNVTLSVLASGSTTPNYQWQFNGVSIFGATSSTLSLNSVSAANSGTYTCIVSNIAGSVSTIPSVLSVLANAPAILSNPTSQSATLGSTIVFSVSATSNASLTYQWNLNGVAIAGATSSSCIVKADSTSKAGNYTCVVTNSGGSVTTSPAVLSLVTTSKPGRLVNLSVLTMDGPGAQMLTLGFVNGGAGTTGSQTLLVRASGPTLTGFSVANVLADPTLALYQGSSVLVSNDNWGSTASNITAVTAADTATGAFPFSSTSSLDSAVVQSLASGSYTVQVVGNGSGVGKTLAEVYDDTASYTSTSPRLVNLSCRQLVPTGGMLTAGFVISGDTSKTVLIRASGPTLTTYGVTGVMPDPQINVYSGSTVIASNAGWAGDASIATIASTIGAFPYASSTSKDSAVLITLAPGSYTAQASSSSGTSGTTIVEVYEVP
jgi:Immunoglobulin domain